MILLEYDFYKGFTILNCPRDTLLLRYGSSRFLTVAEKFLTALGRC